MRNFSRVCLTLALAALLASPSLAQRTRPGQPGGFQPGGPGGRGGNLLGNKSVQEELKLSKEQITKIEEVTKKMSDKQREAFAKLRDLPREQQREKFQALFAEARKETDKATAEILTSPQQKRYKEIQLQLQGTRALTSEEVQTSLKLSAEQKEKIKAISEEFGKKRQDALRDAGRDFQKIREISDKLNKEMEGKIATVLSTDQKKAWKDMLGEKFEIKIERRPGTGRPGTGQPGRPGTGRPGGQPGGNPPARPARPRTDA